jgi:hypothetical protein
MPKLAVIFHWYCWASLHVTAEMSSLEAVPDVTPATTAPVPAAPTSTVETPSSAAAAPTSVAPMSAPAAAQVLATGPASAPPSAAASSAAPVSAGAGSAAAATVRPSHAKAGLVLFAGSAAHSMTGRTQQPTTYDGVPETNLYSHHVVAALKDVKVSACNSARSSPDARRQVVAADYGGRVGQYCVPLSGDRRRWCCIRLGPQRCEVSVMVYTEMS